MPWNTNLTGNALLIAGTPDSPLRVMAGPGTGKSFAMQRRVARLLEEGANPHRILAVTFTRNAAAGLVHDLGRMGIHGCDELRVGTLHSFCFTLLHGDDVFPALQRIPRPLITFSTSAVLQFEASPLLNDLQALGNYGDKRDCSKRILAFEAAWARLQNERPGWAIAPLDRAFNHHLLQWLQFHQSILIGELISLALRYIRQNPACDVRRDYDHVIVDEYQDLNKAEQTVLDLISENASTAIVGDVNQSIYSFRHANPEGILEYSATHNPTHDESLEQCRRCPERIVHMADSLIKYNHPGRVDAILEPLPERDTRSDVAIVQWQSVQEEIAGIASYIADLVGRLGVAPGDIMVLSPRKQLGYALGTALEGLQIPVHSFYNEEPLEERDSQIALTKLLLSGNHEDRVALRFWLGAASPNFLVNQYATLRTHCEQTGQSPWQTLENIANGTLTLGGTGRLCQRFRALRAELQAIEPLRGAALFDAVFPAAEPWSVEIRQLSGSVEMTDESTASELYEAIRTTIVQSEPPEGGQYVRVMSLHKSKGLTSRAVIVSSCVEGLIPNIDPKKTPAEQAASFEESRRLFYVAITRSTEFLLLSSITRMTSSEAYRLRASRMPGYGTVRVYPCRFLAELGPEAPYPVAGPAFMAQRAG